MSASYVIEYHPQLDSPDYHGEDPFDYEELHFDSEEKALKTGLVMDRKRVGNVYFVRIQAESKERERLNYHIDPPIFVSVTESFSTIRKLRQLQGVSPVDIETEEKAYRPSESFYADFKLRLLLKKLLNAIHPNRDARCVQEAFTKIRKLVHESNENPWIDDTQRRVFVRECKVARRYLDSLNLL